MDQLHHEAREIFNAALASVDAYEATKRSVALDDPTLKLLDHQFDLTTQKVYVVAIGKAALSMATALGEVLQNRIAGGVITGALGRHHNYALLPAAAFPDLRRWKAFSGGHPLPDNQSLLAAWQTFQVLKKANEDHALVIFLISGGGSAMIEWPTNDRITLEDLREANRILITCGATIAEINSVRRTFSAVKGGGLAAAAPHTDQLTLIVSDTNAGDHATVASGPSLEPEDDAPSAPDVVRRYNLLSALPESIVESVTSSERVPSPPPQGLRAHHVLLDNNTALQAAARKADELGYVVEVATEIAEQPIDEGCRQLMNRIDEMRAKRKGQPVCLLSGGEFASFVRGKGVGGRNLETVLRCAMALSSVSRTDGQHLVVLSAGTDGIDGNSPAAGAVADEGSIARATALGLDPQKFLDESDSFRFFQLLDSVIMTDVTGTNVRDVRILLAS